MGLSIIDATTCARCLPILMLGAIAAPACWAQTSDKPVLEISGATRLRYETIAGQARAGFNRDDDLINLRTTLQASYRRGPLRVVGELWDSRVTNGDAGTPITTGEVNALEMVQAFVAYDAGAALGTGTKLTLQAGRFVLNLGSRRFVAADDYRNTTNGYTGVRADVAARGGWSATLVYVLPQQRRPDDPADLRANRIAIDHEGFDLAFWGGLISHAKAIGPATLETSFFHLNEHDRPGRPTRDRSLDTLALRIIREPAARRIDYEVEGAVQHGHLSRSLAATAPAQSAAAWFVHGDVGYTLPGRSKTRLSIEYDHASGDAPGGKFGRFDTLFGMRRADLAPAGLYNAFGRTNFISPGLRLELQPGRRSDVMVTARPVWLAARQDSFSTTGVRDAAGRSGNYAGTQLDMRVRRQVGKAIRLELDAVLLTRGRFLRTAPNAPPGGTTRYLSLNTTVAF